METQTTKTPPKTFLRKKAVGSNFLVCNEDTPKVYVQITSSEIEADDSFKREQKFVNVINLETQAKERLWVGGQLAYTLETLTPMKGAKLEVTWKGKNQLVDELTGEIRMANNYSVFEIE